MDKAILGLSLLVLSLFSPGAHAATADARVVAELITYEQFKSLTPARQDLYIEGMQVLFDEWAAIEAEEKLEYQSAGGSKASSWVLLDLIEDARAVGDQRRCLYAGYVSEMDINGRYCMSREPCPGRRGYVKCNPVVFGAGVCAAQGKSASANCARSSKSTASIKREILANPSAYNEIRDGLRDVCTSGKQARVCANTQYRVSQLHSLVRDQLQASPAAQVSVSPSADAVQSSAPGSAPTTAQPTVAAEAVPSRPANSEAKPGGDSPDARGVSAGCPRHIGRCEPQGLMQTMHGPNDRSWAGKTLMNLEQARALMCSLNPINPALISTTREFVARQKARVAGAGRYNRYYQCWYKTVGDNFEDCLKVAEQQRSSGRLQRWTGNSATISQIGADLYDVTMSGNVPSAQSNVKSNGWRTTLVESYFANVFLLQNVDICKATMGAPPANAPASVPLPSSVTRPYSAPAGTNQ